MKIRQWFVACLFMVFMAASGTAFAHDGNGPHGDCHHGPMLSDEKRKLLHDTMKKVFEQDKKQIEEMQALHKEMHNVLAAETFDAQKFTSLSAKIESLHEKIHKDRVRAFASIAGQFTPEERVMIVKMHRHHHHHHHGHDGEHHEGWQRDGKWDGHRSMNDGAAPVQGDDKAYPPYQNR